MKLKVLSTGSKGNSYILTSSNGKYCILDCGISFNDIKKNMTSFKDLDFVFTSHIHQDHSKALKDFELSGCKCISYKNITCTKIEIGQWTLVPFRVIHNELNYGVIIYDSYENKKIVYATDFSSMPIIKNVDNWLYEINYDEFTVNKLVENGNFLHLSNNIHFHNSLENAVKYFEKIGKVNTLIACHLSNIGGTKERIENTMHNYAKHLYIAKKGEVIEI